MIIRFKGSPEIYDVQITIPKPGLIQFDPPIPEKAELTAGFDILTEKGSVYGRYPNHKTIYRELEDGSVILSGDGSVWSPPPDPIPEPEPDPIPEPEPEPDPIPEPEPDPTPEPEPEPMPEPEPEPELPREPSLDERRETKRGEISRWCDHAIYSGVTVELSSGWEHFSLFEKDQINLFRKQAQMAAGADRLEYHQDGHPCRYYTAGEMQIIISTATEHVSYHTTYCNALNMWIAGAEDEQELESIFYGADIPEKYQSEVLKDYLKKIMEPVPEEEEMDKGLVPEEEEAKNEGSVPEEGEPTVEEGEPEIDSDREEVKESETIS